MTPQYQINQNGRDITSNFNDRLLTMTATLRAAGETSSLEIELDDRDSLLAIPPKGSSLEVFMGFRETGIGSLGSYVVDDIALDWQPARKMIIRGHSADLKRTSLKEHRTQNYEKKTLGDVASEIATRAGLEVSIIGNAGRAALGDMVHQTEESDMALMSRLARDTNAIFQVGGGKLIIAPTGTPLAGMSVTVTPADIRTAKVRLPDRSDFGTATAAHFDWQTGQRIVSDGGGGQGAFNVRHLLPDADTAAKAAESRVAELERAKAEVHVELPYGDYSISASGNLILEAFRPGMDGTYTITQAEHNIDSEGYVTRVDGENGNGNTADEGGD